jgi:hypothetical protein
MEHFASSSFNGSTITIAKGDTLTVILQYCTIEGKRTQWSFGDTFAYGPCLTCGIMSVADGVRTMVFTAQQSGEAEIALSESWVLGFEGPHNVRSRFKLKVVVQ